MTPFAKAILVFVGIVAAESVIKYAIDAYRHVKTHDAKAE